MDTIVYIMDEGYAIPTCVSICSIIANEKEYDSYCFAIICLDVSDETKKIFRKIDLLNNELEFYDIPISLIEEVNAIGRCNLCRKGISANTTALIKFWITDFLEDKKKVLYLDGDTIVCDSLKSLFDLEIEDVCVAVARDIPGKGQEENIFHKDVLKCEDYFNSGVMLLNLQRMRERRVKEKLIAFRREKENHLMDQDALNAVLNSEKIIFSSLYNMMISYVFPYTMSEMSSIFGIKYYDSLKELIEDSFILHMVCKPWAIYHPIYSKLFDQYFEKTPYKDELLIRKVYVPYTDFKKDDKIIIYGAGAIGLFSYQSIKESEYGEIVLWVDRDFKNKKELPVSPIESIKEVEYDYIIIAIMDLNVRNQIKNILNLEMKIDEAQILEYGLSKKQYN